MNDNKCAIYTGRSVECKIASAIALQIIDRYCDKHYIVYSDNGFGDISIPDLWDFKFVVVMGVSPNELGMRTLRSLVHDRNLVWIDNQKRNIPMWTEFNSIPGDRNPEFSLVELAWKYYHSMHEPPDCIKMMMGNKPISEMAKLL